MVVPTTLKEQVKQIVEGPGTLRVRGTPVLETDKTRDDNGVLSFVAHCVSFTSHLYTTRMRTRTGGLVVNEKSLLVRKDSHVEGKVYVEGQDPVFLSFHWFHLDSGTLPFPTRVSVTSPSLVSRGSPTWWGRLCREVGRREGGSEEGDKDGGVGRKRGSRGVGM